MLHHSFASLATDVGDNEPTIANLLGHSSHSITTMCAHSADIADDNDEILDEACPQTEALQLSVDRLMQRVSVRVEPLERGGGRRCWTGFTTAQGLQRDVQKTSVTHALHDALFEVHGACPETSYDSARTKTCDHQTKVLSV
jgi:hypothetical protein